ncbi:MAG TPA: hypothetical protein VMC43_00110 [Candidatus Paceibacterota bacterium]|nr:hypothetical protein [Candidatus Paceibacterota bacterium]
MVYLKWTAIGLSIVIVGFLLVRFRAALARGARPVGRVLGHSLINLVFLALRGCAWFGRTLMTSRVARIIFGLVGLVGLGWFAIHALARPAKAAASATSGLSVGKFFLWLGLGFGVVVIPILLIIGFGLFRWWRERRATVPAPTGAQPAAASTARAQTNQPSSGSWLKGLLIAALVIGGPIFVVYRAKHPPTSPPEKPLDLRLSGLRPMPEVASAGPRIICDGAVDREVPNEGQIVIKARPGCWSDQAVVRTTYWGFEVLGPRGTCGRLWRLFGDGSWDMFEVGEIKSNDPRIGNLRFMTEKPCEVVVTSYKTKPSTIPSMSLAPPTPPATPTPTPAVPPASENDHHDGGASGVPKNSSSTSEVLAST